MSGASRSTEHLQSWTMAANRGEEETQPILGETDRHSSLDQGERESMGCQTGEASPVEVACLSL